MLPDGRGQSLPARLRACGDVTPVIILTALDQISRPDRGAERGGRRLIVKPFDLSELSARLNAVARRYSGNPNPLIDIGDLDIDLAARSVRRKGKPVTADVREWALLEALVQRPGQLLSRAQLEERIYSFDTRSRATRSRSMSAVCARS